MIDPLLYMGIPGDDDWHLDIDIVNGRPVEVPVPRENTTNQQRKAVLAYQSKNTIPGDWDRGVSWGNIASDRTVSMADAMMDVQAAITEDEGSSANNAFTLPIVQKTDDGLSLQLLTVSTDDLTAINLGG